MPISGRGSGDDAPVAIYATFPDMATAEAIGGALVERGLAACVNLIPGMRSIYRWQGAIEQAEEVLAIVKSREGEAAAVARAIETLHPYDMPEVVVLPITGGSARYLDWIRSETPGEGGGGLSRGGLPG